MKEEEEKRKLINEEIKPENTTYNSLGSDDPPTPKSDESNKNLEESKLPEEEKASRNQKSLSDDGKGRSKKDDEIGPGGDYIEKPEMLRFGNAQT
jgi:hypothetical protein